LQKKGCAHLSAALNFGALGLGIDSEVESSRERVTASEANRGASDREGDVKEAGSEAAA
jgi:hypothetical protein